MKRKTKGTVFSAALALGAFWNVLCLLGIFPRERWPFSLAMTGAGSLFILIPLLFPAVFQKQEPSRHMPEPVKEKGHPAILPAVLFLTWAVTTAACLVFPA